MTSSASLWQQRIQSSLSQSLQTVNNTVSSLSDGRLKAIPTLPAVDNATRNALPPTGSAASQQDGKQFIRIPLEAARRLQLYDKPDISELVKQHTDDKLVLEAGNQVLRQMLLDKGVSEDQILEELQGKAPRHAVVQAMGDSIATVLLADAQAEVERLKKELKANGADRIVLEIKVLPTIDTKQQANYPSDLAPRGRDEQEPALVSQQQEHVHQQGNQESICRDDQCNGYATQPASHAHKQAHVPHSQSAEQLAHSTSEVKFGAESPAVPGRSELEDGSAQQPLSPHVDSLMEKIRRLEAEKRSQVDELTDATALATDLQRRLQEAHSALDATQGELRESQATAERRLQELRSRVGVTSAQSSDLLRQAQEICKEAEGRAADFERKAQEALERCEQLEAAAVAARSERDAAQKAAADSASAAAESAEEQLKQLRRQLNNAEADHAALERQLAKATEQEGAYLADIRELETAVAEKEAVVMRAAALEERLEETRGERSQLASYKQVAADAEAAKSRVEEELLATAQMVSAMEVRLRDCQAAADAARSAAAASERRAFEAEDQVQHQVAAHLQAIGSDRVSWPSAARREAESLDARVASLTAMVAAAQVSSEEASVAARSAQRHLETLQRRAEDAEARATRARQEATVQAAEASRQLGEAKGQIANLQAQLEAAQDGVRDAPPSPAMQRAHSHSWRGGGGLLDRHDLQQLQSSQHPDSNRQHRTSHTSGEPGFEPSEKASAVRGVTRQHNSRASSDRASSGEGLGEVDVVYLKNVLLKFIKAQAAGKTTETDALLPAVATLLRATPDEFRALRSVMGSTTWWPALGV